MSNGPIRWLIDIGLPRPERQLIDAVHASDVQRVPGHAGIREAIAMDRTLVTCDQDFRGYWDLRLHHPGVVVLEAMPVEGSEIERNLQHLEFRIRQSADKLWLASNRFLLRSDREALRILPDGREVDIEPWRQVRLPHARIAAGVAV